MDALIAKLQERLQFSPAVEMDQHCGRCTEAGEVLPPNRANPTITSAEVDYVEQQLGFRLPTLIRRLSTEVADGGYGPHWGINRLKHPPGLPFGPEWDVWMSVESWHRWFREDHSPEGQSWLAARPRQLIRYCEVGCNISICIDCTTDTGTLFQDDPNLSQDPMESLVPMPETLEEWLWKWLAEPWPATKY